MALAETHPAVRRERDHGVDVRPRATRVRLFAFLRLVWGRLLDRPETIAEAYSTSEAGLWR